MDALPAVHDPNVFLLKKAYCHWVFNFKKNKCFFFLSRDSDTASVHVLLFCTCGKMGARSCLVNVNSSAAATAVLWHFRWPYFLLYSPLELAQTTMASHQKGRQENQTLLSVTVEIFLRGGKGARGPWLLYLVILHFITENIHTQLSLNKCQLTYRYSTCA